MPRLNHSIRAISFIAVAAAFSVEPAYADAALKCRAVVLAVR
jgi:hypothetical protein